MNRDEFLANADVKRFVEWAGHLARSDWRLEHSYKGKGPEFRCSTLYEAFEQYHWPNPFNGPTFDNTIAAFRHYRNRFDEVGMIDSPEKRERVFGIARQTAGWGGINNLGVSSARHWGRMQPTELERHITEIKNKLDPDHADTDNLPEMMSMTSGFSKIYAALIPGLPIYDSRVACALACLIRLYQRDQGVPVDSKALAFPIPAHRGSDRCIHPAVRYDQAHKYADANLKCAWLLQGLLEEPGDFAEVSAHLRMNALQSALFMLGYARLADDAIVKAP